MLHNVYEIFSDCLEDLDHAAFESARDYLQSLLDSLVSGAIGISAFSDFRTVVDQFIKAGGQTKHDDIPKSLEAKLLSIANINPGLRAIARTYPDKQNPELTIILFATIIVGAPALHIRTEFKVALALPVVEPPRS